MIILSEIIVRNTKWNTSARNCLFVVTCREHINIEYNFKNE